MENYFEHLYQTLTPQQQDAWHTHWHKVNPKWYGERADGIRTVSGYEVVQVIEWLEHALDRKLFTDDVVVELLMAFS